MRLAFSLKSLLLAGVAAATVATVSLAQSPEIVFRATDSMGGEILRNEASSLSFEPRTNLLFGTVALSEPARFTGSAGTYPAGAKRLTAAGGDIRVCEDATCASATAWSSSTSVRNGQYVQVRSGTLTTPGQVSSVTVSGEELTATFQATARAEAPTFDTLAAATVSPDALGESGLSTFHGWTSTSVTASGGDVRICQSSGACTDWVASGTVRDGDEIQLRGVAGAFGTTRSVTATAGGATARFDVITRARDVVPDAIANFMPLTEQTAGATVVSNVQQLRGHDGVTAGVAGADARMRVCSAPGCSGGTVGPWSTSASVATDEYVQLQTVVGTAGTTSTVSLSYGAGNPATWSVGARTDAVYAFAGHTFTGCGATGHAGPTLAQCRSAYSTASWVSDPRYLTVEDGSQIWTVPSSGTYELDVTGAAGGFASPSPAGRGARLVVRAGLTSGEKLRLVVGQVGTVAFHTPGQYGGGGGGGASMVARHGGEALVVAGGGGGSALDTTSTTRQAPGLDANAQEPEGVATSGRTCHTGPAGGSNGSGGGPGCAAGGGGINGAGGNGAHRAAGGAAILRGNARGGVSTNGGGAPHGGFGGGGAGSPLRGFGGGGGGYSGGGGGDYDERLERVYGGGGGGSYSVPTGIVLSRDHGAQNGTGSIAIRKVD